MLFFFVFAIRARDRSRYKDGYEEALSLTKLRQLGASFKFPRIGLINGDGGGGDGGGGGGGDGGGGGGSDGGGDSGGGGGGGGGGRGGIYDDRKFTPAGKPGAQRVLGAMSMSTMWTHRVSGGSVQRLRRRFRSADWYIRWSVCRYIVVGDSVDNSVG